MNRRACLSRAGLLLALALVVPACGGGGGGGGAAPPGPAVVVTLTGPAATTELGGTTTITVALATLPSANVTIQYRSSDTTEGTVDGTGTLTFTSLNGTTAQTITVTGEDDAVTDVATAYVIEIDPAVSTDLTYNGLDGTDVNLTNTDDEVVGITVALTTLGDVVEGGANQQFTVTLGSTPTGDVTIPITVVGGAGDVVVSSPGFGAAAGSFNLVLNGANLSRTVTVAAVNDALIEGPEGPYTITVGDPTSTDAAYGALGDADTADVSGGMILDNDAASIVVTPTTAAAGLTLQTTELGSTDTFQVRMGAPVTGQVTLTITGLDATEGTLSTTTVVFDNTNGTTFQTVTVTGIDDAAPSADGDVEYTLTLTASNTGANAADDGFIGLTATVVVTNFDMNGVTLPVGGTPSTPPTATPGVPLGGAGTFSTFKLDHPSVITNSFSGDAFEMFFRGRNSGGIKFDGIGRSVSAAPASGWVHNNGPVFSAAGSTWMRRAVGRPSVIRADLDQDAGAVTADTYIMFYAGAQGGEAYNGIGFVLSNDGVNWFGADTANPSLTVGAAGDWDAFAVDSPSVILVGTTFHMWYTGYAVAGGAPSIGYATAPLVGGVPGAWTKQNLLLDVALGAGGANQFDADGVSDPTVVLDGATYRMWFTATDAARNRTTIGYADSTDPADFSAGKFPVPVLKPHATADAPWGDENLFAPAAAPRVGGGFHLWYSGTGSGGAGIGYIEMQ